ncbi:MAG: coproporphyrinogen dehydrogenase HemZ [Oscillospiraceae bacterium]|nr:coproporphyrinogen dehydrogenase HemZ [Oscillospiraceae bacterium]
MQQEVKPWGTLTGIRPSKVAEKLLISGESADSVLNILKQKYLVLPDRAGICLETAEAAVRLKKSLGPKDIALYVGIPFCPTRCAYCSFVSNSVERSFSLIKPFTETLLREIDTMSKLVLELGLRIVCVYIGGGTPTSLDDATLEAVMAALEKSFDLSSLLEYTVEAGRPDTITADKLETIISHGADRICINPQSMSEDVLSAIGRKHSTKDVYDAVKLIRKSKAALNMDLIAGLPSDTVDGFSKSLDSILELMPENVTVHTLSLKKGSRIMLENTSVPDGAEVGEMLGYSLKRLRESMYNPYYIYRQKYISGGYENTGWSLPGHEGIYNKCMMDELCTVLALGGGGVTKLVTSDGRIERIFNAKYPREYIDMTEKMNEKAGRIRENAVSL